MRTFSAQEGLDALLRESRSFDGYKRENALSDIAALGDPVALPDVIERTNDWVPQVREAAKDALRRLATPANARAYVECLPALYRLRGRRRDSHAETISFVEAYLCSPENVDAVVSGIASGDRAVSRCSALVCIEHKLLPLDALIAMGLAHEDVSVRVKSAALIPDLPESGQDQAFEVALRNTFMPVRRMAIRHYMEVGMTERQACEHLFDPHPSVRAMVVYNYESWTRPPLDVYRNKLGSSVAREQRISVWGVGEYGDKNDAEHLKPFLTSSNVQLRKQAVVSYAKLLEDDARGVVLGTLRDSSPKVASEAARICIKLKLGPGALELAEVLRKSENPQRLTVCLSALGKSGKWERLIFLLDGVNAGVEKTRLLKALERWHQAFNLSFTQPSEAQLEAINSQLSEIGLLLGDKLTSNLNFTLKPYGVKEFGAKPGREREVSCEPEPLQKKTGQNISFVRGVLSSWLFVSVVYSLAMHFDGASLLSPDISRLGVLWLTVGLFSAIYFGVMGPPVLYFLSKREKTSRLGFVVAGLIASLPVLLLCIVSREIEWILATIIAGSGAGWIFTLSQPKLPRGRGH